MRAPNALSRPAVLPVGRYEAYKLVFAERDQCTSVQALIFHNKEYAWLSRLPHEGILAPGTRPQQGRGSVSASVIRGVACSLFHQYHISLMPRPRPLSKCVKPFARPLRQMCFASPGPLPSTKSHRHVCQSFASPEAHVK